MDTNTQQDGGYEVPKVAVLGTLSDLTLHNTNGEKTDAFFSAGTPFGDVTFS